MTAQGTKLEILRHLDAITRKLNASKLAPFTTTRIAADVNVSRNLASQYLNDFVREGLAIKIDTRPVLFLHKRGAERYLQTKLDRSEYASVGELLSTAGLSSCRDFDNAIGFDLSLATCIDQLRSAMRYPPHGLPVLLVGEPGTGKAMLSRLMFDYGVNSGTLPAGAKYVSVDCSRYGADDARFRHDLLGAKGLAGYLEEAAGGIVYLADIDRLSRTSRDLVLARLRSTAASTSDPMVRPARLVLSTSLATDDPITRQITHLVPLIAHVPALKNRTMDERSDLVMHFLRAEGRRVAADVAISRGALRTLVEASFEDNVDGLRTCITNCSAGAYLNRSDERLVIRSYNLPASVLGLTSAQEDDDKLVSSDRRVSHGATSRVSRYAQVVLDSFHAYRDGHSTFDEFFDAALVAIREYQDYLNFENHLVNPRLAAYEQVLNPLFETINTTYGIELSRKSCHAFAQSLTLQLWGNAGLSRWRMANAADLQAMLAALTHSSQTATVITEQIKGETVNALGVELDALTHALLFFEVSQASDQAQMGRENVGIILAHGYSTATSIADAANRILRRHVFDAIDMAYDQEFSDIMGQLSRLLERYAYAPTVAILVDMGSLSDVDTAISGVVSGDLYIVNNVSTGLALEVGSALATHGNLDEALEGATALLAPSWRVVRGNHGYDAVVFCSENGPETADRIRQLVSSSLPGDLTVRLVTTDYQDLVRNGEQAAVFGSYQVRAIMGTLDPGVSGAPYVDLGEVIANGFSEVLDKLFVGSLGPEGIARFHRELIKNVTLRNVMESITILNPERLYVEADRGLSRLQELLGQRIEQRKVIGIYVHICGLIERLVTKNFVETHPTGKVFATEHPEFVAWFRESFRHLCQRYKVEIPVSEIAFVHDFIFGNHLAPTPDSSRVGEVDALADE